MIAQLLGTIYEKTGVIKFEIKIYQGYSFCGEVYLLGLNFELKSHKTTDFMKIVLAVCRLVKYREKQGEKREKNCLCRFQI